MSLLAGLEVSLLAVCLWGLIAVLLTGQFNMAVILGCMAAIVAGYYFRKRGWKPSALVTNITAVLVFATCGIMFMSTFNLLVTTVYLFLFLQVTKYITRQTIAEIRWCYLISLFHVIGASVITTAITFGIMLMVYIFLVLISLRLYVMARSYESAQNIPHRRKNSGKSGQLAHQVAAPSAPAVQHLPRRLMRTSIGLTVLVLALSSVLFSAIPRLATQNLFQAYGPPPEDPAVSAFSENVEFGSFTEIQQDDGVAMFVQPMTKERPSHVRMRGVALDTFDGKAWKRTNFVFLRSGDYDFRPVFTTHLYSTNYKFRVLQPPGVTNFLFGDSFPTKMRIPSPFMFLADPLAQTVYLPEMPPKEFQYEVHSMHEELSERQDPALNNLLHQPVNALLFRNDSEGLQEAPPSTELDEFERWARRLVNDVFTTETWALRSEDDISSDRLTERARRREREGRRDPNGPRDVFGAGIGEGRPRFTGKQRLQFYLQKCLQVPDSLSTGRVPALAREWTEDEETTFAKAMAIESRLRNDFGYTLTPKAKGNFIEDFLTEVREGHCEYFATSMAVLLRNIGVPSRIVNGYYVTEWNGISGNFTARHRDAHSWVEAWMGDEYGWMTFDPTPPGGVGRRGDKNVILEQLSSVMDAVRVRWYRYVVDYSITDQISALQKLAEWRKRAMRYMDTASFLGIKSKSSTNLKFGDLTTEVDWRPVAMAALIIAMLISWQGIRLIRMRRNSRQSAVRFYDDLLRLLARKGLRFSPGQTPREFARHVAKKNEQWSDFIDATELYYMSRYEGTRLSAHDQERLTQLKKAIKRKNRKEPATS